MINHLNSTIEINKKKSLEAIVSKNNELTVLTQKNKDLCAKINILTAQRNDQAAKTARLEKCLIKLKNFKETVHAEEYNKVLHKNIVLYKQLAEMNLQARDSKQIATKLTNEVTNLRHAVKTRSTEIFAVKRLFSPTQFHILRNRHAKSIKCEWSKDDITKALVLYNSSSEAYKILLERGYPFPSLTTVQFWKVRLERFKQLKTSQSLDRNDNASAYTPMQKRIKLEIPDDSPSDSPQCEVEIKEGLHPILFNHSSESCEVKMEVAETCQVEIKNELMDEGDDGSIEYNCDLTETVKTLEDSYISETDETKIGKYF